MNEAEQELIDAYRSKRGIVLNCNFTFGVQVVQAPDGRAELRVDKDLQPIGPAVRAFMQEIVSAWSKALESEPVHVDLIQTNIRRYDKPIAGT